MSRKQEILAALSAELDEMTDLEGPNLRFLTAAFRMNPRNGKLAGVRIDRTTDKDLPGRHEYAAPSGRTDGRYAGARR